ATFHERYHVPHSIGSSSGAEGADDHRSDNLGAGVDQYAGARDLTVRHNDGGGPPCRMNNLRRLWLGPKATKTPAASRTSKSRWSLSGPQPVAWRRSPSSCGAC